jgi:hypothetical protein
MTSKTKKVGSLKKAMRAALPPDQHIAILIQLTGPFGQSPQYDRTAAIVSPTFLEWALRKAIKHHLKPDADDSEYSYLFLQDDAPYRDFASLNRLARALGILSLEDYEQLEMIRHLRNLFAHAMDHVLTFDSPTIAEICDDLLKPNDVSYEILIDLFAAKDTAMGSMAGRRRIFIHAVLMGYWKLIAYPQAWDI